MLTGKILKELRKISIVNLWLWLHGLMITFPLLKDGLRDTAPLTLIVQSLGTTSEREMASDPWWARNLRATWSEIF